MFTVFRGYRKLVINPIPKSKDIHPFLAHLSHWLRVSYCDHWMSVVRSVLSVVCHPSSTIASNDIS